MKVCLAPNQTLDPTAPLDAEGGLVFLPIAHRSVRTHEEASHQATHRTLRGAVHAYARDPSERNAVMVEATVEALRRQRTRSRS
jgi:hypothetical protein